MVQFGGGVAGGRYPTFSHSAPMLQRPPSPNSTPSLLHLLTYPPPLSPGVCNTACFLASRLGRTEVTQADLVAAVEQTKYGRVYEAGRFISPGRKQRFAVVESGYCLAAALLPAIEPIDYVTILPSIKSPVGRTVLKVGPHWCGGIEVSVHCNVQACM